MDVKELARSGLTGVRGRAVKTVSEPIARRTPLKRDQVEAIMGGLFLVLATLSYIRLVRNALAAGGGKRVKLD